MPAALVLAAGVALAGVAAFAVATGSPLRTAVVIGLILLPILGYLALEHPIVFPYGLYVALMPYDVLLVVHSNSTVTKLLGVAAGAFCAFYCVRVRHLAPVRRPLLALATLLVWMTLGVLWSVDLQSSLTWLPTYYGLALLYGVLALTPVPLRDFRVAMGIVVAAFTVAAIFGIHTFYHDPAFRIITDVQTQRVSLRLGDTEIDQNHFANAFLFPIAVAIAFLLRSKSLVVKGSCAAGIGLMVTAILVSGSREAVFALALMLAYYLWRGRNRLQLLLVLLLCAAASARFGTVILSRLGDAFHARDQGRTGIWAVGATALRHYWLTGSGIGTFPQVYDRFYLAVAQVHPDGWARPPHDLLLHYSVETGVVGMALLVWFFIANFAMLRGIGRGHPLYDYRVMVEAGLVGIATVSTFIDLFTYKYAWLVFATAAQVAYLATTFERTKAAGAARSAALVPGNRVNGRQGHHAEVGRLDRGERLKV